VVQAIEAMIQGLMKCGAKIAIRPVQGMMCGIIESMAPELFEAVAKDGSKFNCSKAFTQRFLACMDLVPCAST
jgi:hypothetical protein